MDNYWIELQKALIVLQGKIETIESIQKQKGETFNIFSVLQMERLEVKTHSAFIFEMINPNGSHCQVALYLELFIRNTLGLVDFDLTGVKVKREDPTDNARRIDFTIENDKYFIVIEMKIDASDQPQQLIDYKKHADTKGKSVELFYLTLDGRDASDDSATDEKSDKQVEYKKISFSADILEWVEACIEKSATLPTIRETLLQYAGLIRKITGQTSKEITMQTVEMINNPQIAKAATEMAQNLGYVWALREAKFWRSLHEKLEQSEIVSQEWELFADEELCDADDNLLSLEDLAVKIDKLRSSKNAEIAGVILIKQEIQIDIYQFNYTGLRYYLTGGKAKDMEEIAKIIGINKRDKSNLYGESKIDVCFYGSKGKDIPTPTYDIFDDEKLAKIVQDVSDEITGYLGQIPKNLFA